MWLCDVGTISFVVFSAGDVLGTAMNNLASLLRKPTGCGEQNMMGFAPDVYVLDYLQAAGISNPNVEEIAINFLEIGNFSKIISFFVEKK